MSRMRAFFALLRDRFRAHGRKTLLFWRYALGGKLHFWKYKTDDILLFRLDLIGDCTMFTSAATAIREMFNDRKMTVVCLSVSKPVFERLDIFDDIISVDFRPEHIDYKKLKAVLARLRKKKYDLLLQSQISKTPVVDILAAAARCNRRISIEPKPGNSPLKWVRMTEFLYDKLIAYPRGIVSEFDYYGAFVRGLGDPEYKTVCPHLTYHEQHFIEGKYYVLYPGGSFPQKFWPADRFAKLADHIYHRTGLVGVILGVSSEQWVSDKLKKCLSPVTSLSMIDLTGRTTIADVIDIIGNAALVVSNDTSGVHIACATGTPSVVDVGGWHFNRFLPYHIEDVKPQDKLPLAAYTKLPCYHCDWSWETVGERNQTCLRQLQNGEPCDCIDKITYEQMERLVDGVLEREELI